MDKNTTTMVFEDGTSVTWVFNPMLDNIERPDTSNARLVIEDFAKYTFEMLNYPVTKGKELIVHPFANNKYSIGCDPITGNHSAIVFKRGHATCGLVLLII